MKYETVLHTVMGEKPPLLDLHLVSLINNKLITKDSKKGNPRNVVCCSLLSLLKII